MVSYNTTQEKDVIERTLRKIGMQKSNDFLFYNSSATQYVDRNSSIVVNIIDVGNCSYEIIITGRRCDSFVKKLKEKIPSL